MTRDGEYGSSADAPRDLFPHDRVVFFSDAVFAIAITLLAIELKAPSPEAVAARGQAQAWADLIPLGIAFVISFVVTAQFWIAHVQVWKQVTRVTAGLVWLSLMQLMFVALMPFATSIYSEAFRGTSHAPFLFYSAVLAAISLFAWLTRRTVTRQENLSERLGREAADWGMLRASVPLLVFGACIPLALVLPVWSGSFVFAAIFPLQALARRWHRGRNRSAAGAQS